MLVLEQRARGKTEPAIGQSFWSALKHRAAESPEGGGIKGAEEENLGAVQLPQETG
jgi:hypothetical protein